MVEIAHPLLLFIVSFAVAALAAREIGHYFARFHLPLISGFLFAGMLIGPHVLGFISEEAVDQLTFVNEASLAFIAFAAGSELYVKTLRSRLKSIAWITGGNALIVPILGALAVLALANFIPFMRNLSTANRVAIALLAGAIFVARSPSSAIAIVNELRAKGPLTQVTLGVTMVSDVVVIVLFAVAIEAADALLTNVSFSLWFLGLLSLELLISVVLGYLVARALRRVLALRIKQTMKTGLILLLGYLVFVGTLSIRHNSHDLLGFELFLEPLLIAMIGSFFITNYSAYRDEFLKILEDVAPTIYIVFFTLTGATLDLNVLADTWLIALSFFVVRVGAIFLSSFVGGTVAGDPMEQNWLGWMGYVTQAGVGLGLAAEVAVEFPAWGEAFATLMISAIVVSQIGGPPFYKWAINHAGESHARATPGAFDGRRDAIIFGVEAQSMVLARQLQAHGWQVKFACLDPSFIQDVGATDVRIEQADVTLASLHQLDAQQADAIVAMLSDEENYRLCEMIYEHVGTETVVARINDRANVERFHELDVLVVEPGTATINLLEHYVRSPAATSLLLGMESEQDVVEIEMRNPALHGLAIRDLRLPLDTLVLSIRRQDVTVISHGYTQLELGDHVTFVGSEASLEQVMLRFDAPPLPAMSSSPSQFSS
ncbi:MAG: cation:proton antiporter [Candidatus Promineifilaceae bacterium]|nr:cation:proton antiporter [Candidatus Promineifilaceae bacterium]